MKITDYKDLDIWKKGIDIVDMIYDLTEKFPSNEQYGLSSQMKRAAVSIPSNIAEGFSRQHRKEFLQFLSIAIGSSAEVETQLIIAQRRKFAAEKIINPILVEINHEIRMIKSLCKSIRGRM